MFAVTGRKLSLRTPYIGRIASLIARRRVKVLALVCISAFFAALAGCGTSAPPAAPSPVAAQAAKPKLQTIDVAKLPAVDHATPPLDDGRIELSLPEGWIWAPRSKDYLIKAIMSREARYPSLTLNVEPAAESDETSKENVLEFAAKVQKKLNAELAPQGVKLAENVRAVRIGDFLGAEYVRRSKIGADSVERLFLVTAAKGRKYSLELRVLQGSLAKYRPVAQAVAANIKLRQDAAAAGEGGAP
jgi:hypothetical protein